MLRREVPGNVTFEVFEDSEGNKSGARRVKRLKVSDVDNNSQKAGRLNI